MGLNNPLDAGSLRVFASSATTDGAGDGTTIVCSGLPTVLEADFDGNVVVITNGDHKGESRTINGATTGGTITVDAAFTGQIDEGTKFGVFALRSVTVAVSDVAADIGDASTAALGSLFGILGDPTESQTAQLARIRCRHELPATAIIEEIQVTTGAGDKALGTIVVAGIPSGATVTEAYLDLEFRAVENTSSAGANKLDGVQNVQLQKGAGAFATAIALADDLFTIAASTREGGMLIRGTVDVSSTVTADDTYTIKWTSALADRDNLQFNDVQVRMRITFSV